MNHNINKHILTFGIVTIGGFGIRQRLKCIINGLSVESNAPVHLQDKEATMSFFFWGLIGIIFVGVIITIGFCIALFNISRSFKGKRR